MSNRVLVLALLAAISMRCGQGNRDSAIESAGADSSATTGGPINTEYDTPTKLKNFVIGDWTLTEGDQQAPAQKISFTTEGKFTRYSGNEQTESGLYRVNEQHRILYLEPEAGGKVSEWQVSIEQQDIMKMSVRNGGDQGKSDSFTYERK